MGKNIANITEKVFDSFKQITPALIAIAVLTGLVLFLPVSVLEKMSLEELPSLWRMTIGIVFLLSVSLISTIIATELASNLANKIRKQRAKRALKEKYKSLSSNQKKIIVNLLNSNDKTIKLEKNSGDTLYLECNGFIHMPQQVATLGWHNEMILTYTPQPWLLELYNEEPEYFS